MLIRASSELSQSPAPWTNSSYFEGKLPARIVTLFAPRRKKNTFAYKYMKEYTVNHIQRNGMTIMGNSDFGLNYLFQEERERERKRGLFS